MGTLGSTTATPTIPWFGVVVSFPKEEVDDEDVSAPLGYLDTDIMLFRPETSMDVLFERIVGRVEFVEPWYILKGVFVVLKCFTLSVMAATRLRCCSILELIESG